MGVRTWSYEVCEDGRPVHASRVERCEQGAVETPAVKRAATFTVDCPIGFHGVRNHRMK
ncbi:MAG: hypothetical protein ABSE49_34385 [Polyangiaceae bacterium]|jgi:hypothetical protein